MVATTGVESHGSCKYQNKQKDNLNGEEKQQQKTESQVTYKGDNTTQYRMWMNFLYINYELLRLYRTLSQLQVKQNRRK